MCFDGSRCEVDVLRLRDELQAGELERLTVPDAVASVHLEVESIELELLPEEEKKELTDIFLAKGIPEATATEVQE